MIPNMVVCSITIILDKFDNFRIANGSSLKKKNLEVEIQLHIL